MANVMIQVLVLGNEGPVTRQTLTLAELVAAMRQDKAALRELEAAVREAHIEAGQEAQTRFLGNKEELNRG